jgi:hypothetical protein
MDLIYLKASRFQEANLDNSVGLLQQL